MTPIDEAYERFLDRLEREAIATPDQRLGCSAEEIDALESKYAIVLPHSYRRFLELMGHASGRLFRWDHLATSYAHVLQMTGDQREEAIDEGRAEWLRKIVGDDALIILGRLGEQFAFIRCCDPEDAAVSYFSIDHDEPIPSHDSVLDYLEVMADGCVEAIQSGYFDAYPEGTTP